MEAEESRGKKPEAGDSRAGKRQRARSIPLLRLLAYYALLIGVGELLIWLVPGARLAISAPIAANTGGMGELITGASSAMGSEIGAAPWPGPAGRLALASFAAIGALLLALPVAWVHMFTRRLRYDPSLVQAVIILPIVVAGVVLVVKNSLALAFALAGIVAGVRFRQKLNEPQDAVYVLLALGVGLAAGVQALDVALAVSLIFNVVVLALWRYDLASIYAPGRYAVLATGDTSLTVARREGDVQAIRSEITSRVPDMNLDGILIVHTWDADAGRHAVDMLLSGMADEWHHFDPVAGRDGLTRLKIAVKLDDGEDPVELLGELEERWSAQVVAAEYIPHRVRKRKKKDKDEDEDEDDE